MINFFCTNLWPYKSEKRVANVQRGPAVTGFPVVDGVLAVASIPTDPGVSVLAGGFPYWIVE
jgi:hypothetical protein